MVTIAPLPLVLHASADRAAKSDRRGDIHGPEEIELGIEGKPRGFTGQGVGTGDVQPGVQAAPEGPCLLDQPVAGLAIGQVGDEDAERLPRSRMTSATSSAAAHDRPCTITSAPASPRASATARPIPDVEPSTMVRCPFTSTCQCISSRRIRRRAAGLRFPALRRLFLILIHVIPPSFGETRRVCKMATVLRRIKRLLPASNGLVHRRDHLIVLGLTEAGFRLALR